jgi:hypothetical protein
MALVKRKAEAEQSQPVDAGNTALDTLSTQLHSPEAMLRRQAARTLASMPEAIGLLCKHLQTEMSASVRSIIFTGLITHSSSVAVEGLLPYLGSEDVSLRNGAIEALQKMPLVVAPYMDQVLADPDSDVRILAVNVLGLLNHPDAPARLLRVVEEDSHVNVCAAALDALIEVGELEAIPVLERLAQRFADVAFIQFAVAAAIRRIRGG